MSSAIDDPYRLPTHTRPIRYDLTLTPHLGDATFEGTVTIDVATDQETETLVLNAAELRWSTCTLDGAAVEVVQDAELERWTLVPEQKVDVGQHQIVIEFTGVLNDKLRGWYRSTYHTDDGVEHVIATTQMQSTDCRRAFPCWDEPAFKAVFGITLIVEPDLLAVSNGAEVERAALDDGRVRIRFADTMIMSSYLVAMVVGPLEATDWVDVDGVPMRIVHVPGKADLTDYGLEVGEFALRWFQNYYGIAYPSDKVELIALPDFAAGAMENLGCITFRENLLLVDKATSTQVERQLVADVVAHELAHMWFGDLVTMEWWNGIWLNEAFATFMELAACDAFRPEWERWNSFGLERSVAFETDSLRSTRPVEFDVRSPADAEGMFDVLTYQKGGALLRMLEQYIGPDQFRAGVSAYLKRHAYANTETSDLWDAIEETTGKPVRAMMDSWIWQPGYPLVEATLSDDSSTLSLRQHRFNFDGGDDDGGASDAGPDEQRQDAAAVWHIPVAVRAGGNTATVMLDESSATLSVTPSDANDPVVVNADGSGFFRVAYSADLLARFTAQTLAGLSTLERYNLVDDTWNAVIAGAASSADFLALIQRFSNEQSLDVWQRIGGALRWLRRYVPDGPELQNFSLVVAGLVGPALERLGEPKADESDLDRSLRGFLLGLMASVGNDPEAVERCAAIYDAWEADPVAVDAELAAAATTVVAQLGDESVYEHFLGVALNAEVSQVALRHLYALAEFDDAELIGRTCELAMSDDVKTQNAPFLLNACIANRNHGPEAWKFVRQHWDLANDRFPRNTIVRMVSSVRALDLPDQAADVGAFFAEHPIEQATQTLEQILERQRVNTAMRTRETPILLRALTD